MMYNMYTDEIGKNQIQLIFKTQSLKTQEKKSKLVCVTQPQVFAHAPVHTGYFNRVMEAGWTNSAGHKTQQNRKTT